jgi:hypothetical protein
MNQIHVLLRVMLLPLFTSALLVPSLSACGGDDGGDGDGDGDGQVDGGGVPLSCSSFTLCSYADVETYAVDLAPVSGGTITPGRYRLGWVETDNTDRAGIREDLAALEIRGDRFSWSGDSQGELGSFTTSGTDLTLHYTARCELGAEASSDDRTFTFQYSASGNQLRLQETTGGSGGGWKIVRVFVRMDDPAAVCEFVNAVPASPGDSAQCQASNCFCSYGVETTLEANACPF